MLYGPDGCRGDVMFGDVTMENLRAIAKELRKANELKEAELLIQLGEKEKAMDIIRGLRARSGN